MTKKSGHESNSIHGGTEIERKIAENLVALQKVHLDMAEKFDKLTKQISTLLGLFEMTARSFATHPSIQANQKDKEFLDKIDKLLDQNKVLARGLTLMEERIRERVYPHPQEIEHRETPHFDRPTLELPREEENDNKEEEEYRPSSTGKNPLPRF